MKPLTKLQNVLPQITAVCASMILAACGGGSSDQNIDPSLAQASTQAAPVVTNQEEVTQKQATPKEATPKEATPQEVAPQEVAQPQLENAVLPAAATCGLPNFQSEILRLVKEMRSQSRYCGNTLHQPASALAWNSKLFAAAAAHATDMASNDYFSHTSLDGRTASQRVTAAGYTWRTTGENIAAGQRTVAEVMQGWSDSPGHCANIMNPGFTEVAVSCAASNDSTYKQYWTMSLGAPR